MNYKPGVPKKLEKYFFAITLRPKWIKFKVYKWCLGQFTESLNVTVETGWDTVKLSPFSYKFDFTCLFIYNQE